MSNKKLAVTTVILITLICLPAAFNQTIISVSAASPTQLKIFAGPPSVLADNQVYTILTVQLQDSRSQPARAQEDTQISLSSSLTNVGTVDQTVTILKGTTQTSANFYATFTPGTTTITAAATGYMTTQTTVATVGPIPSAIAVYGFPPILPANGNTYNAIVVQLQDSSGTPAKAPLDGVQLTLSSSNTNVGTVDATLFIQGGTTYAIANFRTNTTGTTTVTTMASGYTSGQTVMTTQETVATPIALKAYVAPIKVPADGNGYRQVVVQLQNGQGKIAQSSQNTVVTLTSSNAAVGTVQQNIIIPAGSTYALANFSTTFSSGATAITAAATNCTTSQAALTTVGPVPSKIAVYAAPNVLPSDCQTYRVLQVQLQDSSGKPAKDPVGDVLVYLFSSTPETGGLNGTLTIPFGQTQVAGNFTTTYLANATTVTAQASGYVPGQARITTYLVDPVLLNLSAVAEPASFICGETANITAYVAFNGSDPASRVTLSFSSNKGGTFSPATDHGIGYYTSIFTSPKVTKQTACTITVSASRTGYVGASVNIEVTIEPNATVTPTPTPTANATPSPTVTSTPTATASSTPKASPTSTPIPTRTPAPTPTFATPTPSQTPIETEQPTSSPETSASPSANATILQPAASPNAEGNGGFPVEAVYALGAVVGSVVAVTVYFFIRKKF